MPFGRPSCQALPSRASPSRAGPRRALRGCPGLAPGMAASHPPTPCRAQPCRAAHSPAPPCVGVKDLNLDVCRSPYLLLPAKPRLALPSRARPSLAAPRVDVEGLHLGCLLVARRSLAMPRRAAPGRALPSLAAPSSVTRGCRGLEPRCLPVTRIAPCRATPCRAGQCRAPPRLAQPSHAVLGPAQPGIVQ